MLAHEEIIRFIEVNEPEHSEWTIERCAEELMPQVIIQTVRGMTPYNIVDLLKGNLNIGIELGVGSGRFSKHLMESGRFGRLFGVDRYQDHHDTGEYLSVLSDLSVAHDFNLVRASFSEALKIFPNNFFDFIYVDGYAHLGQDGSRTLTEWYEKLKVGGFLCGDDYDETWPLVKWAVNHTVKLAESELYITEGVDNGSESRFPSWYLTKLNSKQLEPNKLLQALVEAIDLATQRVPQLTTKPEDVRFLKLKPSAGGLVIT